MPIVPGVTGAVNVVRLPTPPSAVQAPGRGVGAQPYDFARPAKIPRDQLRALQVCLDTFTRRLTTLFTSTLRQVCTVEPIAIEQMTYEDYISAFDGPALLAPIVVEPLPGTAILQFPVETALQCVDHLLGGPGGEQPQRLPTDVETALLRQLFEQVLGVLRYAFEPIASVAPVLGAIEYNPQFVQAAGPGDPVIVVRLDLVLGATAGDASLCLPLAPMAAVLSAATSSGGDAAASVAPTADTLRLEQTLGTVPVVAAASFPQLRLDPADLLSLQVGDVLRLGRSVTAPLLLAVDGVGFGHVVAGRAGDTLAVLVVPPPAEPGATTIVTRSEPEVLA